MLKLLRGIIVLFFIGFKLYGEMVDFGMPNSPATSEWVGIKMGVKPISKGLYFFTGKYTISFIRGKDAYCLLPPVGDKITGIALNVDNFFIHRGIDINGEDVKMSWIAVEYYDTGTARWMGYYDEDSSVSAGAGFVLKQNEEKDEWRFICSATPNPYFGGRINMNSSAWANDIVFLMLDNFPPLNIRRVIVFKEEPKIFFTLNVSNPNPVPGEDVEVYALVTDSINQPLVGIPVKFTILQGTGMQKEIIATSDSSGKASTHITLNKAGSITVHAQSLKEFERGEDSESTNFISDYSFETLTGWNYDSSIWKQTNETAHSGNYSLKFVLSATNLVANESFENGNNNWSSLPSYFNITNDKSYDGTNSLKFSFRGKIVTNTNVVVNSNFNGITGWGVGAKFSYDNSKSHTADSSGSLRFTNTATGGLGTDSSYVISSLSAPCWIYVSGWIWNGSSGSAYLDIYHNIDGDVGPDFKSTPNYNNWEFVEGYWLNGYANDTDLKIRCVCDGNPVTGTNWFDDIIVRKIDGVPNSSFEIYNTDNNKDAWVFDGSQFVITNDNSYTGSYSLRYKAGNEINAHTIIVLKPNTWYRISGRIYNSLDSGNAYIDIYHKIDGDVGPDLYSTQKDTWQYVSGYWKSGSYGNDTNLVVRCVIDGGANGEAWFDDIEIVEVCDNGNVSQNLMLERNSTYRISAYIFKNLSGGNAYIDIYSDTQGGDIGPDLYPSQDGAWSYVSTTWDNENYTNVKIRCVVDNGAEGDVWFDKIEIKKIRRDSNVSYPVKINKYKWYKISGWIKNNLENGNAYIDGDIGPDLHSTRGKNEWEYVESLWFNNVEATQILIRAVVDNSPMGEVWFDDFSIKEVISGGITGVDSDTIRINFSDMVSCIAAVNPYNNPSYYFNGITPLLFAPENTGGGNLIFNPSFENGNPGNSSDALNWTESSAFSRSSELAYDGTWSLKATVNNEPGTSATSDPISVEPGTYYMFSARIYNDLTSGFAYVDLNDVISGDLELRSSRGSKKWEFLVGTWYSGSVTSVQVRCVCDNQATGVVYFDNIELKKVTSLISLGAALDTDGEKDYLVTDFTVQTNSDRNYLYFMVDDSYIYQGSPTTTAYIVVEYLDKGTDTFSLQYDAISSSNKEHSQIITKKNTGLWKQAMFSINDAFFGNREKYDSDFRIYDKEDGKEYISRVWVSKNFPVADAPEVSSDYGSIKIKWNSEHYDLFNVYRSKSTNGNFEKINSFPVNNEYSDTGVTPGEIYYYRITPVDSDGREMPLSYISSGVYAQSSINVGSVKVNKNLLKTSDNENLEIIFNAGTTENNVEIRIYSISGILVWSKTIEDVKNVVKILWDGKGNNNEYLPSGIYVVMIKGRDINKMIKVALIR